MKSKRLISGRAGELTNKANILTFDLLECVFAREGPYRNTLKRFGIQLKPTFESFLVLENGEVHTDLDKEEEILWNCYPIMLEEHLEQVKQKFSWRKVGLKTSINYLRKIIFDSKIIANIDSHLREARKTYTSVSEGVTSLCSKRTITLDEFLKIYEDIISVSYLFEILDSYNVKKVSNEVTKQYVRQNDYLLASDEKYIELTLKLPNGFYLDDYIGLDEQLYAVSDSKLWFVPSIIPSLDKTLEISKLRATEIELQCLKNNLRLKTNVLLYFLNLTALTNAKSRGISTIGDKKLTALF